MSPTSYQTALPRDRCSRRRTALADGSFLRWALSRSLASSWRNRKLGLGGSERVMATFLSTAPAACMIGQKRRFVDQFVKVDSILPAGQEASFNRRRHLRGRPRRRQAGSSRSSDRRKASQMSPAMSPVSPRMSPRTSGRNGFSASSRGTCGSPAATSRNGSPWPPERSNET